MTNTKYNTLVLKYYLHT